MPDTHGHHDRAKELLIKAGIIHPKTYNRIAHDVFTVHLGDVIHAGKKTQKDDLKMLYYIWKHGWFNTICWGNHDMAVYHAEHKFRGYADPFPEACQILSKLERDGTFRICTSMDGMFLSHAGLHKEIYHNLHRQGRQSAAEIHAEIRDAFLYDPHGTIEYIWKNVSEARGGLDNFGGILWKDWSEPLPEKFKQICGHSQSENIRKHGEAWCLDIASKDNGKLCGAWLIDGVIEEIVYVGDEPKIVHGWPS